MIRVVLVNLLLLLLPSILYFSYIYLRRSLQPDKEVVSHAPVVWLLALGTVLMLASLVLLGNWEGGAPGKRYYPPEYRDGVVIPGHVE